MFCFLYQTEPFRLVKQFPESSEMFPEKFGIRSDLYHRNLIASTKVIAFLSGSP
jgi:hypothetical protein